MIGKVSLRRVGVGVPMMMTILITEVIDIVLLRTKIPIVLVTVMTQFLQPLYKRTHGKVPQVSA